jgi:hypothetical protein
MCRKRKRIVRALAALILVALACPLALAAINPGFTPNDLVNQAHTILIVKLGKPVDKSPAKPKKKDDDEDDEDEEDQGLKVVPLEVLEVLKGKKPEAKLKLDLSTSPQRAWAGRVAQIAAARGDAPVPLFIGKFKDKGQGDEAVQEIEGMLLPIDRTWVICTGGKGGVWNMDSTSTHLLGTWDGGSDMLIEAVRYLLRNPGDKVPIVDGVKWAGKRELGKLPGTVNAVLPVDLSGKGKFLLFAACSQGDRLYAWDAAKKSFADVGAKHKLDSKSVRAAWADFDADGRPDLASWDGSKLRLHLRGADSGFARKLELEAGPRGEVLGLAAMGAGAGGKPGLLVSTAGAPLLLRPGGDGKYAAARLPVGGNSLKDLGAASACLAADFDGDGLCDVLQPFEKAGLAYKGKGGGEFEPARRISIATVKGRAASCTGDYDMDGKLDVWLAGPATCTQWNNRGAFKFVETFQHSGEIVYTAGYGGTVVQTCDFNNDGLQDLFLGLRNNQRAGASVHLYFNRGWRSFGKALTLVWGNTVFTDETAQGIRTGLVADFNADGAQDMAVVLNDGKLRVYLREAKEDSPPLSVRVLPPAKFAHPGPIAVTGWSDTRCLGAWNLAPGSTGGFFGAAQSGRFRFEWQLPGGGKEKFDEATVDEKRLLLYLDKRTVELDFSGEPASAAAPQKPAAGRTPVAPAPGKTPPPSAALPLWAWCAVGAGAAVVLVLLLILRSKRGSNTGA